MFHSTWYSLGFGISTFENVKYLLTVYYFYKYLVIRKLDHYPLQTTINILKSVVQDLGAPHTVMSGADTSFKSNLFLIFANYIVLVIGFMCLITISLME